MDDYKIKLGVDVDVSDIQAQINKAESQVDPIKIKIDAETKELTNSIRDALKPLTNGTKNALTIDTSKAVSALNDVDSAIKEIKTSLGTLDNKSGMKSLLSSINQINGALEKTSNQFVELKKNIKTIGGKDINLKLGVKLGGADSATRQSVIKGNTAHIYKDITKQLSSNSDLNSLLKEFRLTGENAEAIRSKFASLAEVMSHGVNSDLYEESLVDLTNTIKKLGTVSKQSDDDMKDILNTLRGYSLDVAGDYYKQEFGDDWKSARNRNQAILANKNSRSHTPVDVAYEELSEAYPFYFPKDIWNPADQLRKIFEVYGTARHDSKNRNVDISEVYSDSDLRAWTSDIARNIHEQIAAEQQLAQSSTEATRTIVQNENNQKQALEQKKHRLEEIHKLYEDYSNRITNLAVDQNLDDDAKFAEYNSVSREIDKLEQEENLLKSQITSIESSLEKEAQQAQETANVVVQNEERKQQAYRETNKLVSDSAQKAIDNVSSKSIDRAFRVNEDDSLAFKREMENLVSQWTDGKGELTDIKIDTASVYDENTERYVEEITRAQVSYNNELGETIKKTIAWRQIGTDVNVVNGEEIRTPVMGFVEVAGQYSKSLGKTKVQTDAFVKQQKQAVSNLTNQINQLNRAASDQNATRPIKDTAHLDTLKAKYNEVTSAIQRLENASTDTFSDEQNNVRTLISEYKSLVSELRNAENVSSKMKGTDFDSGLDIARNDLEKFKAQAKDFPQITATIKELDKAIENVGDVSSLNKFNDQLRVARSELAKVKSETIATNRSEKVGINVSGLESKIADLQRISPEIDKFETEIDGAKVSVQSLLSDLKKVNTQGDFSVVNSKFKAFSDAAKAAGIAVTETVAKAKSALANDIKLDIELGNFENEIDTMRVKFNSLSDANDDLRRSVELVENAYQDMLNASKANTGDEVADRERLIEAEKKYAAALEKTNNLIKIQARADKKDADALRLQDDREIYQAKIDTWLEKNSAAARKFGGRLQELRAAAQNADRVELNHLEKELIKVDKAADKAGLKMMSLGDQIKSKFKEYMAYLSAAEVFMYAEQAARSMYETVKEIDTAMTGLYRVTDLTDYQYDVLFDDMISSAKEYGATLTDIINATTDWVRAGFDADTSLGLAEVTTMYQHISDLDYDTAAENLITAYNGFKDELNGAFDGDQVAAVEYIADIFNELDNNFAVTSAGLGEALTRSASALDLAGNTIQETAGMITGIVEVTQDPEQAGSTLKILSLRLRGKRIMPPYKESLYALFGLKYDSNIEDNYICQNARVAQDIGKTNYIFI